MARAAAADLYKSVQQPVTHWINPTNFTGGTFPSVQYTSATPTTTTYTAASLGLGS